MIRLRSLQQGVFRNCQKQRFFPSISEATGVRCLQQVEPSAARTSSHFAYYYYMPDSSSRHILIRSFSSDSRGGGSVSSPGEGRSSDFRRRRETSRGRNRSAGRNNSGDDPTYSQSRRQGRNDQRTFDHHRESNRQGTSPRRHRDRRREEPRWGNMNAATTPRRRAGVSGSAAEGRVVLKDDTMRRRRRGSSKHGATSQMCVGCGTEVTRKSGNMDSSSSMMLAGQDAVGISDNKKQAKSARFINTTDEGDYLCHRCTSLQSGDIWSAYDALRDVSPKVFKEQLKHVVSRRKFGFCIMVVDATDPEHTAVRNLRQCVGSTPVLLVLNKIDLLPRMTQGDLLALRNKIQQTGMRFLDSFAVSASTGEGLDHLARHLGENIEGADVFVVGAANVGKSSVVRKLATLLSKNEYLKGNKRSTKRRRDSVEKLQVTGSNLPGTTLQAVRIPCFPSDQHALWDTPGIINGRALQYGIFPAHLMEPLTRPGAMVVPTEEEETDIMMRPGESILIEAGWMHEANDDDEEEPSDVKEEEPCVLARLDFVESGSEVRAQAYLHPSLRMRVVRTIDAPAHATIPDLHVQMVKQRIRQATGTHETGLKGSYSIPLMPYIAPERPTGEMSPGKQEYHTKAGRYYMDISFASLGWIAVSDTESFSTIPHCVRDSFFSKRRSLYPTNLREWLEDQEQDNY